MAVILQGPRPSVTVIIHQPPGAGIVSDIGGGPEAVYQDAKPYLEIVGGKVVYCGEAGAGQAVKICNNMMLAINLAGVAEGMTLIKELGLDPARVNPNGGAIALGHPVGATGAIITVKAMYELERTGAKRALMTMCIGGGQGIAVAIERL